MRRVVEIGGASTFVSLDQPGPLAREIVGFLGGAAPEVVDGQVTSRRGG
jgi:hypothetical protein